MFLPICFAGVAVIEKVAISLGAVIGVLALGIVGAYWWLNIVPARPAEVASDAVFLWAPHVGLPAPRRGQWLSCRREAATLYRCTLTQISGRVEYVGEFVPYPRSGPVAGIESAIDAEKSREQEIWIGDALVPLVHLTNGTVLIPASKYQEGTRLLVR
jgi:hypothetical protein